MIAQFEEYIKQHKLFQADEKLLLGFSGGRDSVVLAQLLKSCSYSFSLAHCNFQLRAEESEQDALFSEEYAKTNGLSFFQKRFDTLQYAEDNKISVQMAARELRFEWFESLCKTDGFTKIVLAHHADDQIETFFINLIRGSSLGGLKGMKASQNNIVRPLLFASRKQIDAYIEQQQLSYREDSTNKETDYLRNKIRHLLIERYSEMHPNANEGLLRSMELLGEDHLLFQKLVDDEKERLLQPTRDGYFIETSQLINHPGRLSLLYALLRDFGFNTAQVKSIHHALDVQPGAKFIAEEFILHINSQNIEIQKLEAASIMQKVKVEEDTKEVHKPLQLKLRHIKRSDINSLNQGNHIAFFDKSKLKYPLFIRNWQFSDRFHPFGMKGSKLLSDFFIDLKLTAAQKAASLVLTDAENNILWVIGRRSDNRFKVEDTTEEVLRIEIVL